MNKSYYIKIPEEISKQMDLQENQCVSMHTKDDRLIIRVKPIYNAVLDNLKLIIVPALCCSVLLILNTLGNDNINALHIGFMTNRILNMLMFSSVFCSIWFLIIKDRKEKKLNISFTDKITEIFALSMILYYISNILFIGINIVLKDITFNLYFYSFVVLLMALLTNAIMIKALSSITPIQIIKVIVLLIICCVLFSSFENGSFLWWQHNFSFLGSANAKEPWRFNNMLILMGPLFIFLFKFTFSHLKIVPHTKQFRQLNRLITLIGLSISLIGLFPFNLVETFFQMHNYVATSAIVLIMIMIIEIKYFLPDIPKDFIKKSLIIFSIVLLSAVLYLITLTISLTAFETIAILAVLYWFLMLIKYLLPLTNIIYDKTCTTVIKAITHN